MSTKKGEEAMKKMSITLAVILCLLFMCTSYASAGEQVLKKGVPFPVVKMTVPDDAAHRSYLGLSKTGTFEISDIKAQVVIVEIFSMY